MGMINEDCQELISCSVTAHESWKALEDACDRNNITNTFHTLFTLLDYQKDDSIAMPQHIQLFENHWNRLLEKVSFATSSSEPYARGLKIAFMDSKLKAHMLLHSLPPSMANVVDNLQTKDSLTYNDVRSRLLDLASSSSAGMIGDAFLVKKSNKKKDRNSNNSNNHNQDKGNDLKPSIAPADECSYCWKRNLPSKGHTHTNCAVLKQAQSDDNPTDSDPAEREPLGLGASKYASNDDSGFAFYAYALIDSPAKSHQRFTVDSTPADDDDLEDSIQVRTHSFTHDSIEDTIQFRPRMKPEPKPVNRPAPGSGSTSQSTNTRLLGIEVHQTRESTTLNQGR